MGYDHIAGIKNNGTLWSIGNNSNYEIGDGININATIWTQESTSSTNWDQVSCGFGFTTALKTNGYVYCWGLNDRYQCSRPLGTVTNPTREQSNSTWSLISANFESVLALKSDNTLWGWGANAGAELGINGQAQTILAQNFLQDNQWYKVSQNGWTSLFLRAQPFPTPTPTATPTPSATPNPTATPSPTTASMIEFVPSMSSNVKDSPLDKNGQAHDFNNTNIANGQMVVRYNINENMAVDANASITTPGITCVFRYSLDGITFEEFLFDSTTDFAALRLEFKAGGWVEIKAPASGSSTIAESSIFGQIKPSKGLIIDLTQMLIKLNPEEMRYGRVYGGFEGGMDTSLIYDGKIKRYKSLQRGAYITLIYGKYKIKVIYEPDGNILPVDIETIGGKNDIINWLKKK
jgi:hypothetical protein